MNQQVLYLTYDGLTDPLGQSQILPYVKGLSKEGYTFTILSCDKPARFLKLKTTIQQLCDEDNINWVSFPFTANPPILSKIRDRKNFKKLALELHLKNQFDLVHCRGYISAEIGLYMQQNFGTKFLFDMRGLWADEKVDAGRWNLKNPIFKLVYKHYKKNEKLFLENANYTISLTEAGKKEIHSWQHIKNNPVPIQVIPCCVDINHFDSSKINDQNHFKNELKIKNDDFIISYLGSIGTWYMLSEMLDFFKVFLNYKSTAKFLFITGDDHSGIKKAAIDKGIAIDKVIIRQGKRNEVPTLLSLSQLSVFFIRPTYSKISSSPTKQGEIMAMGVPVICNMGIGDTAELVNKYESGIVVEFFTNIAYTKAIEQYSKTIFNTQKLREGAIDYFSLEKGITLYQGVYKNILL